MAFDPFGDFEEKGYLRNHAGSTDMDLVKDLEHASFRIKVGDALETLSEAEYLNFSDVKQVHEILFEDVYPWAGQDRSQVALDQHITKGDVEFMYAGRVGQGVDYALSQGSDPEFMREHPGEVMGNLAYAHPFLDGNGRTIMTVHSELCRRADMHIDWSQTNKADYLEALTAELDEPGKGKLDAYLEPFVRDGALDLSEIEENLQELPGLGPKEHGERSVESEAGFEDAGKQVETADTPEEAEAGLLRQATLALESGVISQTEFDTIKRSLPEPGAEKDLGLDDDFGL